MPQTSRAEQDTWNAPRRRMSTEQRVVLMEAIQVLVRQLSEAPQGNVHGPGGMTFGQNKSIVSPHRFVVNEHHCVYTRQVTAQMTGARSIVHFDQPSPRAVEIMFAKNLHLLHPKSPRPSFENPNMLAVD